MDTQLKKWFHERKNLEVDDIVLLVPLTVTEHIGRWVVLSKFVL